MNDRFTIIQQGDGNTANQVNGPVGPLADPVADHVAMARFLQAAAGSLPALALPAAAHAEATRTLDALDATDDASDDEPTRTRRRELAASLWRIVEGAAGSALGTALLGLWHP